MMKISIISFYSGLIDRGVETWAKSLKENLGRDFEIVIMGGEKYGHTIDWQNKSWLYWSFLVLRHAVATRGVWSKADIIIPTNGGFQILFCRLITWVFRKSIIVFGHAGLGADDKWNLLCMPNVFVAFSDRQKNWASHHKFPWTKLTKINHAVDLKRFSPPQKKPRKKVVLCVSADTHIKRINLVKEACKLIDFKYVGIGKGNDRDISFEKMPQVYRESDIFCFVPKPIEAFGLVYLEALASNLPVVATDDPIRREIIGDAGIFVKNPQDLKSLSEAIKETYNRNWGDKPRKQAEKFSWERIRERYINLFQKFSN